MILIAGAEGSVRSRWPEWAQRSNRSGSGKPASGYVPPSTIDRFGPDPLIAIPARGFWKRRTSRP